MDRIVFITKAVGFAVGFLIVGSFLYPHLVHADELWVTSGMWSHHNNEDHYHYQQDNTGLGLAYKSDRFKYTFIAGEYLNSLDHHANYFGIINQPWSCGPVRIGYATGFVSGYTKTPRYEFAFAPMATYEFHGVGMNLIWVPSVVVAAQFKLRVW